MGAALSLIRLQGVSNFECESGVGMLFAGFAAKALGPRRVERYSLVVRYGRFVGFSISCGAAGGVSRLRARPKGAALWNPAAFEKAGETFFCAPRTSLPLLFLLKKLPIQ